MKKPDKSGRWLVSSPETDGCAMPVTVSYSGRDLWVDDPALGEFPVDEYNAMLTEPEWQYTNV